MSILGCSRRSHRRRPLLVYPDQRTYSEIIRPENESPDAPYLRPRRAWFTLLPISLRAP